jgi:hypothetical protein
VSHGRRALAEAHQLSEQVRARVGRQNTRPTSRNFGDLCRALEKTLEATRGPEYRLTAQRVHLQPGTPAEATLQLVRWTHPAQKGWWSSDAHIHANYTSPHHQVIEPRDVRLQVAGEDLNYANLMVANASGAFIHDRQYFEAGPHRLSTPEHFLY